MLKGIIISLLFTIQAYAFSSPELPEGHIKKLSFIYHSPQGEGIASDINIKDFGSFRNSNLSVTNDDGVLDFKIEDRSFQLDLSFMGVKDTESLNLKGLYFLNLGKKTSLSLSEVISKDINNEFEIRGSSIQCEEKSAMPTEDLLSRCLENADLEILFLRSLSSEKIRLTDLIKGEPILSNETIFNEVKLKIVNGKLKGSLKSNLSSGIKIKLEAEIRYDKENKIISIKLIKVKAGFFNIKNRIFEELEKIQDENLRVERPYIYIQLKK